MLEDCGLVRSRKVGRVRTYQLPPRKLQLANLEVAPGTRLVWTTLLEPGFRPSPRADTSGVPHFTAVITIEPHGAGTKYTAVAMHRTPEGRHTHDTMGFQDGWGAAFTQLVEAAPAWARTR